MDKWRKIRAKLTGRKSGKSKNRDKTIRHSRSMPSGLLRTSADTEKSTSTSSGGQEAYDGRVLDIGGPGWPKIGQKDGRKNDHQPDCDCWYCGNILDEFPSPPPLRPRHRPRDLSQDFDDIEFMPDAVYEARKQRRESEKKEDAERKKILHVVSSYRARAASSNSSKSHKPIVVTDEEYDILRRYEPGFHWANRSTRSLGANVHLSGGPSPKKPQLVRKTSRSTIAGARPQIVNDRSVHPSTQSHDGHGAASSVRSLRYQTGYRNLSRNSSVASRAPPADYMSVRRPSDASSLDPAISFQDSVSIESHRSNRLVVPGSPPRGPRSQWNHSPKLDSASVEGHRSNWSAVLESPPRGHRSQNTYSPNLPSQAIVPNIARDHGAAHVGAGGVQVLPGGQTRRLASKPLPAVPVTPLVLSPGSSISPYPARK